ncbi:TPA: hypothetical protein JI343_RS13375 [Acinetobacter baumannii]|nr:hypothetical protein [Acinetobacter baumannii]HBI8920242.1 hypothetical protein [Acinetobacter baumannii]
MNKGEDGIYRALETQSAWMSFQRQQAKVEGLQKRVEAALELMQKPVIVGEPAKYVCARFKEIEQALKGEGCQ